MFDKKSIYESLGIFSEITVVFVQVYRAIDFQWLSDVDVLVLLLMIRDRGNTKIERRYDTCFWYFQSGHYTFVLSFLGFGEVQPQSLVGLGFKDIIAYGEKHYKVQWMDP